MPDVFTKAKRSEVMSRIRSRGNRDTELALAAVFRRHGITGWRRHRQLSVPRRQHQSAQTSRRTASRRVGADSRLRLRVKPDFVFPKPRLAVFVDGCFWHACPRHATKPRHNAAFWRKKLAANQARDRKVNRALRAAGWRVVRIWEHQLRRHAVRTGQGKPCVVIRRIQRALSPG